MKRIMTAMALVATVCLGANAQQQRPSKEEMEARRAEKMEKRAEKLATDFELKGDAKEEFKTTYKEFQTELQGLLWGANRQVQQPNGQRGEKAEKKKMTEEEAVQQLAEYFGQQEEQIATQQKRFDLEKKYYAKLQNILKPQQLVKIFHQRREQQGPQGAQRGGQQRGSRPGGFGGPQGGFGGPQGGGFGGDF